MSDAMLWVVPTLYLLSFAGLGYFILQALGAGAEAYSREYTASAARQLEDIFVFIPPRRIIELATGCALLCFVFVFVAASGFSPSAILRAAILGTAAGLVGWNVPAAILKLLKKRRLRRFNEQLVDALLSMSNALRAGFSILQSFESVVKQEINPISQEFSVFLHQTRIGVRLEEALQNLQQRVGSEDLALMISSIEIARQTGGSLPDVFDRIAQTIRERMRIERRIRTLTAQGRLQGIVVGAMPVGLAAAMFALDPGMMLTFFRSPVGIAVIVLVAVLETAGALLIRKIIRIDV
jgi:tight adherence protein B